MKYGSVCSGIEAATAAWHPLGWKPAFFSEIEKFPRTVLEHHYPDVPLHGDFTTIGANDYDPIDLLVGGTPCQSFSIAGLRGGLDDDRGNLALEYLKLAKRKRPQWVVWENVPGVLSSNGGRDFGAFLGGLGELGYGWSYRILDAQYFRIPQRRRRVFVVGYLGDWRVAAAVLFERHSLQGHLAPIRKAGKEATRNSAVSAFAGNQESRVASTIQTSCDDYSRSDSFNMVTQYGVEIAGTLTSRHDSSPCADRGQNFIAFPPGQGCPTIVAKTDQAGSNGSGICEELSCTLDQASGQAILSGMTVRRLTPTECERLQGFPDNYTQIAWRGKTPENCPDGPRYKALGNSMAVPCMHWMGQRIEAVQQLIGRLTA